MSKGRERKIKRSASARRKPNYQVFLSHATADKWTAKVICEKIEATGASTFRDDRDINGGDDIPEEIRNQMSFIFAERVDDVFAVALRDGSTATKEQEPSEDSDR